MLNIVVGIASLISLQIPAMPAGTPLAWVNDQTRWKQVGAALMAKAPEDVRQGDPYRKLKYLYGEYTDLIIKSGAPLNWNAQGRAQHGLTSWTCGSHATMLDGLFNGAGIKGLSMIYVHAGMSGTAASLGAGVNSDHGCLFIAVDGVPVAFDPWLPAFMSNKTYSNGLQLDFGGLPYPQWEMVVRHYGYDRFSTQEPAGQGVIWRDNVKKALEDANLVRKDGPKPPQPERSVGGGHWSLDKISAFTTNLPRYGPNSCAAAAVQGTFWAWVYETKGTETVLVRSKVTLNVAPSLAFLTPGTASFIATITEDRLPSGGAPSAWVDCLWSYGKANGDTIWNPGRPYVGIDRTGAIDPASAGPYVPTLTTSIPIPTGAQGGDLRIILASEAGGVHYMYKWSDKGSAPDEIKKPTFAGRWQTEFGIVEFKVKDRQVTGTYPHDSGRLQGQLSLDGFTVTGTWSEAPSFKSPNDAGDFEFRMSEDGKSFAGSYWYGTKKKNVPGKVWNGKLIE